MQQKVCKGKVENLSEARRCLIEVAGYLEEEALVEIDSQEGVDFNETDLDEIDQSYCLVEEEG